MILLSSLLGILSDFNLEEKSYPHVVEEWIKVMLRHPILFDLATIEPDKYSLKNDMFRSISEARESFAKSLPLEI